MFLFSFLGTRINGGMVPLMKTYLLREIKNCIEGGRINDL